MDALIGLLGVVLGFALGAIWDERRRKNERDHLSSQLREEVRANIYVIPQKKATIRAMLAALSQGGILPGESVPFCDTIYGNHIADVASHLSQKERNLLQVIYSTLSTVDRTMAEFEPAVTSAERGDPEHRVIIAYSHKLQNLLPALDEQEALMQSFLSNEPVDVFHMDRQIEEVKRARITKG